MWLILSSLNVYLTIARVSVALFPRFSQNLTLFLCRILLEITSGEIHDSKQRYVKKNHHVDPAALNVIH
jgi:hypothetical protein